MLNKLKVKTFPIVIFVLFSLISLFWFRGNNLIGQGDNFRMTDFFLFLTRLTSAWNNYENTGFLEFSLQFHLPFSIIYLPLGYLGIGPVLTQKIWLFSSLFFPMYFMYIFLNKFWGTTIPVYIKTIVSVFYAYNPLLILLPIGISITKFPIYLALPLLGYILLLVFEAYKFKDKLLYAILLSYTSLLAAGSFRNIAEIMPGIIVLILIFLFKLNSSKKKILNILSVLVASIFSFLLNFWWIFSSFVNLQIAKDKFIAGVANYSPSTKIGDSLRLLGSWALHAGYRSVPYYPFGDFYYTRLGVLISYLLPILVFSSLLFLVLYSKHILNKRLRKKALLSIFIALLGVFLVKGGSGPFGTWYVFLYDNVPLFRIFREPYSKFSLITLFGYTMTLCFSLYSLDIYIKRYIEPIYSSFIISIGFSLVIFGTSFPLFNGQVVANYTNGVVKQAVVKVPQYWRELHAYSKSLDKVSRVLTLPQSGYYGTSFIWQSGFTGRPTNLFLQTNSVYYNQTYPLTDSDKMISFLYTTLENYLDLKNDKDLISFVNLSRILGIDLYLQQNDLDYRHIPAQKPLLWNPSNVNDLFRKNSNYFFTKKTFGILTDPYLRKIPYIAGGVSFVHRLPEDPTLEDYVLELKDINPLVLYSLKNEYIIPKIYFPTKIINYKELDEIFSISGNLENLDEKIAFVDLGYENSFASNSSSNDTVNLHFENPSRYKIKVPSSLNNKLLVFNETFDNGWGVYRSCNKIFCKEKTDFEHIRVNYYANGWVFNTVNNETFYIIHESQNRLYIGLFVSGVSFIVSIVLLLIFKFQKRHKHD